jgi:hypothetical protein
VVGLLFTGAVYVTALFSLAARLVGLFKFAGLTVIRDPGAPRAVKRRIAPRRRDCPARRLRPQKRPHERSRKRSEVDRHASLASPARCPRSPIVQFSFPHSNRISRLFRYDGNIRLWRRLREQLETTIAAWFVRLRLTIYVKTQIAFERRVAMLPSHLPWNL